MSLQSTNDSGSDVNSEDGRDPSQIIGIMIMFETMVHHMLYSEQWDDLERLCDEVPSMAKVTDKNGRSPLHLAVYSIQTPPSLSLIKKLIDVDPSGASRRDKIGCTPLHYASNLRAGGIILPTLLEACPEAATMKDKDGDIPLYCCRTVETTKILLQHFPEGVMVQNNDGSSPLSKMCLFCLQFIHSWDTIASLRSHTIIFGMRNGAFSCHPRRVSIQNVGITGRVLYESLHEAWEITCALIQSASSKSSTSPILHTILSCIGCPLHFCRLTASLLSEQTEKADCDGNYPLHIAASMFNQDRWQECIKTNDSFGSGLYGVSARPVFSKRRGMRKYTDTLERLVAQLVEMFRSAARIKNNRGQLPLNLMSLSGTPWRAGVAPVVEAYPTAIHTLDLDDNVMPKVLVRVANDCNLETMFEVIRGRPTLLKHAKSLRRSTRKRTRAESN